MIFLKTLYKHMLKIGTKGWENISKISPPDTTTTFNFVASHFWLFFSLSIFEIIWYKQYVYSVHVF